MAIFARGVAKTVAINPEATFGVIGAGAGQLLRRTSSDLNLSVQQVQSQEILPSQQVRDSRNGPRQVQGTLAGQLSPSSYTPLFEGLLRSTFAPVAPVTGLTDTQATTDANGNYVVTSATANWATHFKIGDIVRPSGLTGLASSDNGDDLRVVMVSSNSITLQPPGMPIAWNTAQTDSFALPGKKLIIPATGQLDKSFSLEHWYSDTGQSETFVGCKVTQLSLNVPASGFCTMQASITGRDMQASSVQQFPGAAVASNTTGLTATTGKISYNGVAMAYITAFALQIVSSVGNDQVVGSNLVPGIFLGTLMAKGSLSALTTTDTLTTDFLNENEVSLSLTMTSSPAEGAEFISIHLPRVKLTSSTKNDSDKAIVRSFQFMALENSGSVPNADFTTVMIQDSQTP